MHTDPGTFVWHDLTTSDAPAAQTFYRRLLGWGTASGGPGYAFFTLGDAPIAGVVLDPAACAAAAPFWMGNVGVTDVDAAAERARRLGGTVAMGPADIPGVGRFAVLADPAGAAFSVFAAKDAPRPGAENCAGEARGPGRFCWSELRTRDPEAALAFYGELLGWRRARSIDLGAENGSYVIFANAEGRELGGMVRPNPGAGQEPRPHWFHYLEVRDLEATVQHVEALGGSIDVPPMPIPGGGAMAHCRDPQGAPFGLSSE